MGPPEPMLSATAVRWPAPGSWVLQPKWDGFRLLIEVGEDRRVRAWSRRGVNLAPRVASLAAVFGDATPGTILDGELVAIGGTELEPIQDFAMVCRAVLRCDRMAQESLRFVVFDVLRLAGEDLRGQRWAERDRLLPDALPQSSLVRRIDCLGATEANHAALLALGFEGSVLKRRGSTYRAGRSRGWVKQKARYTAEALLLGTRQDREGQWHASCDVGGRRVTAIAGATTGERVGDVVTLVYSRVDADGGLREARLDDRLRSASS